MILFLFYLIMASLAYTLFLDILSAKKDKIFAVLLALVWPAWIPLMFVFILIAILQELR